MIILLLILINHKKFIFFSRTGFKACVSLRRKEVFCYKTLLVLLPQLVCERQVSTLAKLTAHHNSVKILYDGRLRNAGVVKERPHNS
jgi:hypothetical protein